MYFNYPYTDLYSLNLDWIIKAIKEVQELITDAGGQFVNSVNGETGTVVLTKDKLLAILGDVVTSINGETGDVTIDRDYILAQLGDMVSTFNGRSGAVTLSAEDVNATAIDILYVSDSGESLADMTQADLRELYDDGKRILIFVNNLGVPDRLYIMTEVGDTIEAQPYTPASAQSGVVSINGQSGNVTLTGDEVNLSSTDTRSVTQAVTTLATAVGQASDAIDDLEASKQDTLTFDTAPTANSSNPVTSGGVYSALLAKQSTLSFDTTPTEDSTNPVTSGGVYTALEGKEDALTFDNAPVMGGSNPVTSGGIYNALALKQNTLTFDSTPTANSTNPVTSGGVYSALTTAGATPIVLGLTIAADGTQTWIGDTTAVTANMVKIWHRFLTDAMSAYLTAPIILTSGSGTITATVATPPSAEVTVYFAMAETTGVPGGG